MRRVPLIAHDDLLNYNIQGWRWVDGKEPDVDDYAGNAADIPSTPVDTEPVPTTANRLAGGNRLDRRFEDFNDQAVVASYLTHQAEAYARKSDARCLTGLINAATVVAPGTVPAGVAKGLAAIVDGALGVIGSENRPAWSLVSPELWRDIILTPHEDILGYLSASFGLEEGDMAGYKLMPANVGVGKVITGAKESATFYELPGSPVRVSGVNPGSGSSDIAAFGYWAQIINNAKAVASVTVAP